MSFYISHPRLLILTILYILISRDILKHFTDVIPKISGHRNPLDNEIYILRQTELVQLYYIRLSITSTCCIYVITLLANGRDNFIILVHFLIQLQNSTLRYLCDYSLVFHEGPNCTKEEVR